MLPQTGTCSYDSTSNALSILNKTIFLWEVHTENSGKSFNMLYDIVDLFLVPVLERLLSQLQAKCAVLNSWVWRVTDIKPRQSKSNLFLFIITNWWMHLFIFWSKPGSWCVTSLFLKKFAQQGFWFFLLKASLLFFLCHEAFLGLLLCFQVRKLKNMMHRIGLTTDRDPSSPFSFLQSLLVEMDAVQGVVLYFALCAPWPLPESLTFTLLTSYPPCASFLTNHFPAGDG